MVIKAYKKSMDQETIYNYKQKAELNKHCLIFHQAWGNDEQSGCCLLSASTSEQEQKWDTFTEKFTNKMHT